MAEWKKETVTLAYPVTANGETRREATIREPDLEALEVIEGLGIGEHYLLDDAGQPRTDGSGNKLIKDPTIKEMRAILEVMSDLPREFIGKLHRDDFQKIARAMFPLLFGPQDSSSDLAGPAASKA